MQKIDDRLVYQVTWLALHVSARAMTRDRALGFVVFVQGLRDLFPLHDVRDTLTAFLKDRPLDPVSPVFENGRSVFTWTFDLHQYCSFVRSKRCGKPALLLPTSVDQVWDMYGPERFSNNSWGGPFWVLFHYAAANLPSELSQLQLVQWIAFVRGFSLCLPCGVCRNHMNVFMIKYPLVTPTGVYRSGMQCWQWTVALHADVNARLGKAQLSDAQVEGLRQSLVVEPGASSGTLICPL